MAPMSSLKADFTVNVLMTLKQISKNMFYQLNAHLLSFYLNPSYLLSEV